MVKTEITEKKQNEVQKPQEKEARPIEKLLQKSDVLLMLYPKDEDGVFSQVIQPIDEITIYENLKNHKSNKESLVILLDTSGGNVYSAVKIMDTLRTRYKKITIAIPYKAKSSGTMMCLGADELIMCSISELGPLDKPMYHPGDETIRISALDIIKSIDDMLDAATLRQKKLGKDFTDDYGIPIKTSLSLASESISRLITPMLRNEDVKIYNQAKRLLTIAETYGLELLNKYMYNYIERETTREKIVRIFVRRLVWLYPDHGFAIRRDELKEWFFIVRDAEKLDYWEDLWKEYKNFGASKQKLIKFL